MLNSLALRSWCNINVYTVDYFIFRIWRDKLTEIQMKSWFCSFFHCCSSYKAYGTYTVLIKVLQYTFNRHTPFFSIFFPIRWCMCSFLSFLLHLPSDQLNKITTEQNWTESKRIDSIITHEWARALIQLRCLIIWDTFTSLIRVWAYTNEWVCVVCVKCR